MESDRYPQYGLFDFYWYSGVVAVGGGWSASHDAAVVEW